jgi:XTP/dITP diphosphohydrolase/tetrapyrrole methylase family protein/MazG family protein/ATP diphosphatase
VTGELEELEAAGTDRDAVFHEVGDLLFAAVNVARKLRVDPELALRSASGRFRWRIEEAERLAADAGVDWEALAADDKLTYYIQARISE